MTERRQPTIAEAVIHALTAGRPLTRKGYFVPTSGLCID
jgi:hypothetical protein